MMKPWRYPHLFTLWQTWLEEGQTHQLDHWLAAWFKRHKQYGKKDRKAYADAMFNAMRFIPFATAAEKDFSGENYAQENFPKAAFWYWILLRSDGHAIAPRELTDSEQRLQHFEQIVKSWPSEAALSTHHLNWFGLQQDLAPALEARQKAENWAEESLRKFIAAQVESAPLWLRPQGINARLAKLELAEHGIEAESIDGCLKLAENVNLSQLPMYQQGLIEVQDYASQHLAKVITPEEHQTVWDVCAGAGGKSLAVASSHPSNSITASDSRSNALKQLQLRVDRAKLGNIKTLQHDATQPFAHTFDWVFIDAPCSSSGVWRRSPDSKLRLAVDESLLNLQASILSNATHFNPVDLVCGIKNYKGEKFNLLDYVDHNTAFITMKSKNGVDIKALELPGLWNGSRAFWNTIFVEVPLVTFNPVKTANDLLKPAHQA